MSYFSSLQQAVFLDSQLVHVHPCGRRGSKRYSQVFDPEAFLNTERNRIGKTALNGYQDTYIVSYDENGLKVVISGYYFEIIPHRITGATGNPTAQELFGDGLTELLNGVSEDATGNLYLEICLEDVQMQLQTSRAQAPVSDTTKMLKSWFSDTTEGGYLDQKAKTDAEEFYFTGLRLRFQANTGDTETGTDIYSVDEITANTLRICSIKKGQSQSPIEIYQPMLLPRTIVHGGTTDSVLVKGSVAIAKDFDVNGGISITGVAATKEDGSDAVVTEVVLHGTTTAEAKVEFEDDVVTEAFKVNKDDALLEVTGETAIKNNFRMDLTGNKAFGVTATPEAASTTKKNSAFMLSGTLDTVDGNTRLNFWVTKNPPAGS